MWRGTSVVLILTALACRANYRDWQTPGCRVDKPDLKILQISDTHVAIPADGVWLREKLKAALEKHQPDLLIHTGDVTLDGAAHEWRIFESAVRDLKPAPLLVWGNHDMPLKDSEWKKEGFTRFVEQKNYRLVFLDSAWPGWFKGSYTEVPETELSLLSHAAETEKPILLFAHHPLAKDAPGFRLNNADAVLAVFAHKKLSGVFTGHFHGAYIAPADKTLFAGVTPLTLQRFNHTLSQSKGYRLIELENGCLRTKHFEVD